MSRPRAAAYALRALAYLTRHEGEGPAPSSKLAAAEGLPGDLLSKVLKRLASAGVLVSSPTMGGGHWLACPAKHITLLDVVEAVDGPVRRDVPRWAADANGAPLGARLQEVRDAAAERVRTRLRQVSVADLAGEG
jgi:Rrf2 family protein